eukprot:scaffold2111_cov117-Skeletonema_dohrnii-CCMP3373.AAC.8
MVKLRKYLSRTMRWSSKQSSHSNDNRRDSVKTQLHLNLPDVHVCNSLSCNACSSAHSINFIRVVTTNTSESSTP